MIEHPVEPISLPKLVNVSQAAFHYRQATRFKRATKMFSGLQTAARLSFLVASIFYSCFANGHSANAQTQVEAAGATKVATPVEVPNTLPALLQMIEIRYKAAKILQGEAKIVELTTVMMLLGSGLTTNR